MTVHIRVNGSPAPQELPPHISNAYAVDEETGCWLWRRSKSPDGYGWSSLHNRTYQAHRLVYEMTVGTIPEGMVLDHLCRVRHCVNPAHLEPVSMRENLVRSPITTAGRDNCLSCGGPLTYLGSQRRCLPCRRRWESRNAAAIAAQKQEKYQLLVRAAGILGITTKEYRRTYGDSQAQALEVLRED